MALFRSDINQVFTRRRATVNKKMYETRPDLERALRHAVDSSMQAMLFGDLGPQAYHVYSNHHSQDTNGRVIRKKFRI
jgi:hypothetical protein